MGEGFAEEDDDAHGVFRPGLEGAAEVAPSAGKLLDETAGRGCGARTRGTGGGGGAEEVAACATRSHTLLSVRLVDLCGAVAFFLILMTRPLAIPE